MIGRFAPSPTGPLHFGSLVAAVGSWLFVKKSGGTWIVRMEDLDRPRVAKGADVEIIEALERYGLRSDAPIVYQSRRTPLYEEALEKLLALGRAYWCSCSRADLQRAASAPAASDAVDEVRVYPGTCRMGLAAGKPPRAIRFDAPDVEIEFEDLICGTIRENVAKKTGDFVIRRADGLFAYQLAVVVDDADQGVTQVVRGGDLLESTARQITLQQALGLPTPKYAHLPLLLAPDGTKLGKRSGALPLSTLDDATIIATLSRALELLGVSPQVRTNPESMLQDALNDFEPRNVPRGDITV